MAAPNRHNQSSAPRKVDFRETDETWWQKWRWWCLWAIVAMLGAIGLTIVDIGTLQTYGVTPAVALIGAETQGAVALAAFAGLYLSNRTTKSLESILENRESLRPVDRREEPLEIPGSSEATLGVLQPEGGDATNRVARDETGNTESRASGGEETSPGAPSTNRDSTKGAPPPATS